MPLAYFIPIFALAILCWWHDTTNWNPSDGPESEDELGDNFTHTL